MAIGPMVEEVAYKVCILAAGRGSRLEDLTEHVNKALIPIAYKPVLSHILENVPTDVEVIIAVGYRKELIEQFAQLCYGDRKISLVDVGRYQGPGSGPGYSLLKCKELLQCPFVVTTCDTMVLEKVPRPDVNWMGVAHADNIEDFCSVTINGDKITKLHYKEKVWANDAFIGIAGVRDYQRFWDTLEHNQQLIEGEVQLANGLAGLTEPEMYPVRFTWFDTGDRESLQRTGEHFGETINLDKDSEFIYFLGPDVVKFFPDPEWVSKRVQRGRLLGDLCPEIVGVTRNFYKYRKVAGQELAGIVDDKLCQEFLEWSDKNLWKPVELQGDELEEFYSVCRKFYRDKTLDRLYQFYASTGLRDGADVINGNRVPALAELLDRIDWSYVAQGIPARFHGDFHFDNVIVSTDKARNQAFCLLDWRQDFGGIIEYGDLYYDLSKMYHALTIAHEAIKADRFYVNQSKEGISFDFWINHRLISCRYILENYIVERGLDLHKVRLLTNLIFLNMSPLHQHPFNLLLYYMGKLGLHKLTCDGSYADR
ncbi:MAG: NTP transferase domain-containing protein [Dehalococcoidia bacterium]